QNNNEIKRAYIDMTKQNIEFRYPIIKLDLIIKSFDYASGNLGVRLMTQDGKNIDTIISEGVNWTGWHNVEVDLPTTISLYPLRLTNIYYEITEHREDIGVLIFDKLEGVLENNNIETSDFYVVEEQDTLKSISEKIYGSDQYVDEIIINNNLSSPENIRAGKILVLKYREYEDVEVRK